MKHLLVSVAIAALTIASPAFAQTALNINDSTSGSNADANSASNSGAASVGNVQGQQQDQTSVSVSDAVAVSGSESESRSNSDQNQGQSSQQGQTQGQNLTAQQGQNATNNQGVSVSNTFNSPPDRKTHEVRTNNAVPLTSSSSFSSDYCGGSMSAGASGAPIGLSIGISKPVMDKSCQALRRAEKFGMAAVNALNMNQPDLSGRLMSMMIWSICTSDSDGPRAGKSTSDACDKLALLGSMGSNGNLQPPAGQTPQPRTGDAGGKPTVEAAARAASQEHNDVVTASAATVRP